MADISQYQPRSGQIIDESGNIVNVASVIDTNKNAIVSMTPFQKAVMDGKLFVGYHGYTIAAGATSYLQIKTNSEVGTCFYVASIQTDGEKIVTKFIESPAITDGTTEISLANMNRESTNTCTVTAYSDPTSVSGGTQLDEIYAGGIIGQKIVAGEQIMQQNPFRLAKNKDYILAFMNNGTAESYVQFRFLIIDD